MNLYSVNKNISLCSSFWAIAAKAINKAALFSVDEFCTRFYVERGKASSYVAKGKKKMQMAANAKPIFDMSKAVPIGKSGLDTNNLLGGLTQAQLDSPAWNGAAFKARRREYGITQEEIAERTKLTQERISQIENDERMTEETGLRLWNALFAINYEKGQKQIQAARDKAQRLRGTPEGEAEAKKAGAWFEGFYAAGGMGGWLSAGEKDSMQKVIEARDTIIEGLRAELAVHQKQANWQPVILELAKETKRQKEVIDMLVNLLDVETVKGLASKEAEELREEIATRFRKSEK